MAQTILIKRSNTSGAVPTTSQLSVGELALNTRDGKIYMRKYVDGTTGNDTITLIGDTSTIAGSTFTGNLNFGDNVKAQFGAGNDLQIYHTTTGNHSIIAESGAGNLILAADNLEINNAANNENKIVATSDGAVTLYHNNSAKLTTTSTGIDVTGTVVADEKMYIEGTAPRLHFNESDRTDLNTALFSSGGTFTIRTINDADSLRTTRFAISNTTGDISFYNDSAAQGLFWDSSASRLGLGTTVPSLAGGDTGLHIHATNYPEIKITNSTTGSGAADGTVIQGNGNNLNIHNREAGSISLATSNVERLNINSSGNATFTGTVTGGNGAFSNLTIDATEKLRFDGLGGHTFIQESSNDTLTFATGGSTRMTLDSNATFSGAVTANAGVVVDQSTFEGNKITTNQASGHSGNFTIDVAGDIVFDADGGDFRFKDNGTQQFIIDIDDSAGSVILRSSGTDGDIVFQGDDGGTNFTALTLDMSAAGEAIFNSDIRLFDSKAVRFGTDQDFRISNDGSHTTLQNSTSNQDILFKGNDDGTPITALTLDMSNAGKATFSGIVSSAQGFERGNMFITQNEIDVSSGDLLLDVAGTIKLDADNSGTIYLQDAGNIYGIIEKAGSDLRFRSGGQDADIVFMGNDGGSLTTALTLDMSAAGAATFNSSVHATRADLRNTSSGAETTALSLRNYAAGANTATALTFYPTQSTTRFASIVAENVDGNNNIALSFLTSAGDTPTAALTLNQDRSATFSSSVRSTALISGSLLNSANNSLTILGGGSATSDGANLTMYGSAAAASAGEFRFRNGTSEKMRLDSSGRLGIGTASPTSLLHLSSGSYPKATFSDTTGVARNFSVGTNNETFTIRNETASADAFTIDNANNAHFHSLLDLPSKIRHTGDSDTYIEFNANDSWRVVTGDEERIKANNGEVVINDNSADMDFRVESNNNTSMLFVDGTNDKVGIGTSAPASLLNLSHATAPELRFSRTGTGQQWVQSIDSSGRLLFLEAASTGGTLYTRMVIDDTGEVGIGTGAPSSMLHVAGGSATIPTLSSSYPLTISNNGNSGLNIISSGTTNAGQINFGDSGDADAGRIRYDHNDNSMRFTTNATEYMRITSAGRVSVGTTTPARTFHVVSSDYSVARLERIGSGGGVSLEFRNGDGNIWGIGNDGDEVLRFYYAGVNRLQVTSGGAVRFNNAFTFPTADGSAGQVLKTDGSGNLTFQNDSGGGSASSSISDSDGDTKIQVEESSDEDKIRFDTAGTQRMLLDNTGKLAVGGNQDPVYPLDLRNPSDSNQIFRVYFPDAATTQIGTSRMASGATQGLFVEGQTGVRFGVSGTEYGRFHSNGNFGIGTTAPSSLLTVDSGTVDDVYTPTAFNDKAQIKIDVASTQNNYAGIQFTHSGNTEGFIGLVRTSTNINDADFVIQGYSSATSAYAEKMRITDDGKVGIGTASPAVNLHILESSNSTTPQFRITNDTPESLTMGVVRSAAGTAPNTAFISFDNALRFIGQTGTTNERMRITEGGNVGIGTTAPQEKLHVYTTGASRVEAESTTGFAAFKATNNSGSYGWYVDNSADKFHLYDFTDNANRITLDGAGNVGIGTTAPSHKLHVKNDNDYAAKFGGTGGGDYSIEIGQGTTNSSAGFNATGTSGSMLFKISDSEKMRIKYDGNVGIGTNAPSFPLTVYGANQNNGSANRMASFFDTTSATTGTGAGIALGGYTNGTGSAINDFGVIQGIKENGTAGNYASALTFHTRANGAGTLEQMRISSTGNVGIGTASPISAFHVKGDAKEIYLSSADYNIARIIPRGTGTNLDKGLFSLFDTSVEDIRLDVGGVSWIDTAANVGIGTKTAGAPLVVNSTSASEGLRVQRNGVSSQYLSLHNSTNYEMCIDGVCPNGSPKNMRIFNTSTGSESVIRFGTSNAEKMRIDTSGNLIVGKTATTFATQGAVINHNGTIDATRSGDAPLYLNRLASDGNIIALYKATVAIGSIGSNSAGGVPVLDIATHPTSGIMRMLTSGSERMRIDASGNLGIGTASPSTFNSRGRNLVVNSDGDTGITISSNTSSSSTLLFADAYAGTGGTAAYRGSIEYDHATDHMAISTAATERMRITSAGILLVGTTSTTPGFSTTNGHAFHVGDASHMSRDGGVALVVNRGTSDGGILQFRKSGTYIGGIESRAGVVTTLLLNPASGNGAGISGGTKCIVPADEAGIIDNDISLGISTHRFKDLHLSGTANVGGNLVVTGDLTINGTTTTLNTATLDVEDKNITLNYGSGDTSSTADGAGITIQDAVNSSTDATILWDASNDRFNYSHGISLPDNQIAFFGTGSDGRIKFDGTDTLEITASNGTGDHIKLKSNNISLQQANGNNYLTSSAGSATTLYFANAAKIATASGGASVTGALSVSGNLSTGFFEIGDDSTTTTATTQVAIAAFAASSVRSCKLLVQVTNTTDSTYHFTEVSIIHDGTDTYMTEVGSMFTGTAAEATFTSDISSGSVRLLATPASTDSITFKVVRQMITV